MIVFGIVSSLFDYITFGLLLFYLKAGQDEFRTGWFVESVVSAALIVLVIRSSQPFFKSRPGKYLLLTTGLITVITRFYLLHPLPESWGWFHYHYAFIYGLAYW